MERAHKRSNEVDGLGSNDGILVIGSTNDLDQLDFSVTKRPSRFDRKYHFGPPDETRLSTGLILFIRRLVCKVALWRWRFGLWLSEVEDDQAVTSHCM